MPSPTPTPTPAPEPEHDVPIEGNVCHIIYLNGDNNLDSFAGADMQELNNNPQLAAGVAAGFRACTLVDRTGDVAKRYMLTSSAGWELRETVGEVDMANEQVVRDNVAWCLNQCQEAGTNLFFISYWDHGGGVSGLGGDDNTGGGGHSGQSMRSWAAAISDTIKAAGLPTDQVMLGYDACLMSQVGPMAAFSSMRNDDGSWVARYQVSSEALEPGFGWTYNHIDVTKKTLPEYGATVVDAFMQGGRQSPLTLALVDLKLWDPFWAKATEMFAAFDFNANEHLKRLVTTAIQDTKDFRGSWSARDKDFGDFLKTLKEVIQSGGGGSGGSCTDHPQGWHDNDGEQYTCAWYSQGTRCSAHGSCCARDGVTANQACCACGGGNTVTTTTEAPSTTTQNLFLPLIAKIQETIDAYEQMILHFATDQSHATGIAMFLSMNQISSYHSMTSDFSDVTAYKNFLYAYRDASLLEQGAHSTSKKVQKLRSGHLTVIDNIDSNGLTTDVYAQFALDDVLESCVVIAKAGDAINILKPYAHWQGDELDATIHWDAKDLTLNSETILSEMDDLYEEGVHLMYSADCQYKANSKVYAALLEVQGSSFGLWAYTMMSDGSVPSDYTLADSEPGQVSFGGGGKVRCKTGPSSWSGWGTWAQGVAVTREATAHKSMSVSVECDSGSVTRVTCAQGDACWVEAPEK
jgi:hypothetical protein